MPLVTVKLVAGVFTAPQKRRLVEEITDALVRVEGEHMRPVTWVLIEEVKSGDWGIAGRPMTTEDVKALQSGRGLPEPRPQRAARRSTRPRRSRGARATPR